MSDLGAAHVCGCPVVAGAVRIAREQRAVEVRTGQDVVGVRIITTAVDDSPFFGQRVLLAKLVVVRVEIGHVLGTVYACGVVARARCLSAPASPPRFAPLPDPTLVMKKLRLVSFCAAGVARAKVIAPAATAPANLRYIIGVCSLLELCKVCRVPGCDDRINASCGGMS